LNHRSFKTAATLLLAAILSLPVYAQVNLPITASKLSLAKNQEKLSDISLPDSTQPTKRKFSNTAIFMSLGGGLNVPLRVFKDNSVASFGILGRLELGSTKIFPFVVGLELSYFKYNGSSTFTTVYTLNTFDTKIFSYGLSVEYALSQFFIPRTAFLLFH